MLYKGPSSVSRLFSAASLRSPESTAKVSIKGLHTSMQGLAHTHTHTQGSSPYLLEHAHRCTLQHMCMVLTHTDTKVGHTHLHTLLPHTNQTAIQTDPQSHTPHTHATEGSENVACRYKTYTNTHLS